MRAYVAVTDDGWYRFLRARPEISEVNFWQPTARGSFSAITTGEPFLFKTHRPDNMLVGGGFLSGWAPLRVSTAWELFGHGNGVGSLEEMRDRISRYRKQRIGPNDDPEIGCILLRDVAFAAETDIVPAPEDFARNIVRGKGYDLAEAAGSPIERALRALLVATDPSGQTGVVPGPAFGDPRPVTPRVGQQAFKALVTTAYHDRCAVTGAKIRPVLQAAHIRPVAAAGEHRVDNGLLLRSDVHIMFDQGYLSVSPAKYELQVSPRIRSMFNNGEEFYARAGSRIELPDHKRLRPAADALEWHMDHVFRR